MEIAVILFILFAVILWRTKSQKGIQTITTAQLKDRLNDKTALFIDVRTPAEFKSHHIRQFKNVPLGKDFSNLPKNKEIIVICQSGMRSKQACHQLKKLGFEKVTNVRGGMSSY